MSYFEYNSGVGDLPEGAFKISPSQLSRFFDDTSNWWREMVLGESAVFQGNTGSYLGTVVHGLANMYVDTRDINTAEAEKFIRKITNPDVDKSFIASQFETMSEALIEQYLKTIDLDACTAEEFMFHPVMDNVVVGGSIDLRTPEEIVDYKTTNELSPPKSVKRSYYFQQMCYVWMARQKGYSIKRFRLVCVTTNQVGRISETTGKPMKDYPTTVTSLVHEVTDEDMLLIDGVLKLVAESVKCWQKHPEMRHLLAQDMRLKVKPKLDIFGKHNGN